MDVLRIDKYKVGLDRNRSCKTRMRRFSYCVAVVVSLAVLVACNDGGSSTPSIAAPLPDGQSAAAQLFTVKCGECHFRPQPVSHTAAEWINVVHRMDGHRTMKGKGPLTEEETKQILGYLERHAKAD
jgi:hypothetical protein